MSASVTCGIDWASDHHDVALVDADGNLLAKARIGDDAEGLAQLLTLLAEHGESPQAPIPVAIETSRGLLVAALRCTSRPVYAINPMAAARYRERHAVTRKQSGHLDAMVLANILRTDADVHRALPADRARPGDRSPRPHPAGRCVGPHPGRQQAPLPTARVLSGFLAAVASLKGILASPIARALLAATPTPEQADKLTRAQLRAVLKKAGRSRGIDAEAERLREALCIPQMRQLPLVEQAMGRQALALAGTDLVRPGRVLPRVGPARFHVRRTRCALRRLHRPHVGVCDRDHGRARPPSARSC